MRPALLSYFRALLWLILWLPMRLATLPALVSLLVAPFATPVLGQSFVAEDTLRSYAMDPIVVTGTRVEVSRSNVPLTVSTIPGSVIRSSTETNVLPVLSRHVPGLFVTERGMIGYGISNGSAGHIRIRGVGGSPNTNILVMVDGHPQFMGIFGHPFPDAYVAGDAARVEVVRGPASILYGTGAMGGVINIITGGAGREGVQAAASAAYGSYQTQHYSGSVGFRRGGRDVFASVNHDRTDGHRSALDAFDLTNAYLKLGSDLGRRWHVTVDGRLTQFHTEDPGPTASPNDTLAQDADVLRSRVAISLENRHARVQGAVKAFLNYGEHEIFDGFESEDHNLGLIAYQGLRLQPNLILTVGADVKRYGGDARNVLFGQDLGDFSVTEFGGYGLLQYHVIADLLVAGGVRVERHSEYGAEPAPQIGVAYGIARGTTLKLSAAKGYRSPTILELYLFGVANPDLKPERMWNYEAGVLHTLGRLDLELVGFLSKGSNLIEVRPGPGGPIRSNAGSFRNLGLEFRAAFAVTPQLSVTGNVSALDMDAPILGAPELDVFAEISYDTGRFSSGLEFRSIRDLHTGMSESEPAGFVFEDYALVHLRAAYRPADFVEVFLRLENLLDESYQINLGYPMPGRTIMSGVRVRY